MHRATYLLIPAVEIKTLVGEGVLVDQQVSPDVGTVKGDVPPLAHLGALIALSERQVEEYPLQ